MSKPFWKSPLMGKTHEFALYWAETGLAQKALNEKRTLVNFSHGGTLKKDDGLEAELLVNELINNYDLRVAYRKLPDTYSRDDEWMLINDGLVVNISYTPKNRATTINCYGVDEQVVRMVQSTMRTRMTRKVTKGRVYIVVQGNDGPYLHEMGTAGETFEPTNYREAAVAEYRHIVADLNDGDPCGRIIILDGPPGTGKTHMVRALLNEVPKATFVLIPSNMMSQLGSPSFIKALLREQKKGYPMILVVEDADEAIAARDRANMSEISALLNFSDGIFGAMMDLRIICTTNADVESLDEAVMRPGRLCRRIEVGKLDHVQAAAVYKRLGGLQEGLYTRGNLYTLGQVYQDARGSGGAPGAPRARAKGRLGFQVEADAEESPKPLDVIKVGDTVTLSSGEVIEVADAEDAAAINKAHIGTRVDFDELFEDDDDEETPRLDDDDDDLIDEDPVD